MCIQIRYKREQLPATAQQPSVLQSLPSCFDQPDTQDIHHCPWESQAAACTLNMQAEGLNLPPPLSPLHWGAARYMNTRFLSRAAAADSDMKFREYQGPDTAAAGMKATHIDKLALVKTHMPLVGPTGPRRLCPRCCCVLHDHAHWQDTAGWESC